MFQVLGILYFEIGNYDFCIEIEEYEKSQSIKLRDASGLVFVYDAIADALEHKGTEHFAKYKSLYKDAYYLADFYNMLVAKNIAKQYYEENIEPNINWYG